MNRNLIILFFISVNLFSQDKKDILFSVNDSLVYVEEFERVYNKNSDLIKDSDRQDIVGYLDLFINYKLKLAYAYDIGLNKDKNYILELNKYIKELQKSFLTDKESEEKYLKEAYERTKSEVNVSHVLIRYNEINDDSLHIISKLSSLRDSFSKLSTNDFNNLWNLDKKMIVEDLGYFSAFKMIYSFENIAYNTPVGSVSKPFRTKFGYHILKVNEKRKSLGEINVAHVMIYKNSRDAYKRINSVLDSIKSGFDFEYLAKKYSEDKNSSFKGGILSPFSSGQINSIPFEKAAFSLENIGDYSNPIETKYGWHIIKLYSKNDVKKYDDVKFDLLNKLKKSSRFNFISDSFYSFLLSKYNLDYNNSNLNYFSSLIDSSYFNNKWNIPDDIEKDKVFFKILNTNYSFIDFAIHLDENQGERKSVKLENIIKVEYKRFLNSKLLETYKDNLENDNIEYRYILKEYREGLLLFNLMQDKIWDVNYSDSLELKEFYSKNKSKYTSFENDKSNILSDYQLALENDWINELKLKYSVWVNRKVLKKLKKLYDL